MTEIDNDTMRKILEAYAADGGAEGRKKLMAYHLGEATKLRCQCGGVLHQAKREVPIPKGPRWSRNRRIRRKLLKRWQRDVQFEMVLSCIWERARGPSFACASCGRPASFYQAVAHNMFPVEKMPEGALPYYGPCVNDQAYEKDALSAALLSRIPGTQDEDDSNGMKPVEHWAEIILKEE
jgi:hypothetical protein